MPTINTARMTARQFFMLGEDPPGLRPELVDGEIAVSPSPRPPHSRVDKRLSYILLGHIIKHDLGELLGDIDTVFGEYDVRRPGLIFFRKDRVPLIKEDAAIDGPPDLCVEIVSPSSGTIDRKDKFEQYAIGGVAFYWIVDPQRETIEAYRLIGDAFQLCGQGEKKQIVSLAPFTELQIALADIWFPA